MNKNITSEDIKQFISDIYILRKGSIEKDGEYGLGNLVFKEFRNLGYLDNLRHLRKELKGKELSLEQLDEDLKQNFEMTGEEFNSLKEKHPELRYENKPFGTLIFDGEKHVGTYLDTFGEMWCEDTQFFKEETEEKFDYLEEFEKWNSTEGKKERELAYRKYANLDPDTIITEDNLNEIAVRKVAFLKSYPEDVLIKELLN